MIKLGDQQDWTKSSYSVTNACVEVRSTEPSTLSVSDSKFHGDRRPQITVSPAAFTALVDMVRS